MKEHESPRPQDDGVPTTPREKKNPFRARKQRTRCGECDPCLREDCGKCRHCLKKTKFGGDGTNKSACIFRRCIHLQDRLSEDERKLLGLDLEKPRESLDAGQDCKQPARLQNSEWTVSESTGAPRIRLKTTRRPERKRSQSISSGEASDRESNDTNSDGGSAAEEAHVAPDVEREVEIGRPPASSSRKQTKMPRIKLRIVHPKKKAAPPPDHLYGRQIPTHDGKCAGCFGERNGDAKDEPVLLCDGHGCSREYHLGCTNPPLAKVPDGEFYCMDCDAYGTTSCLRNYFERCDDARSEFQTSREYVESLLERHMMEAEAVSAENQANEDIWEYEGDGDAMRSDEERKRKRSSNNRNDRMKKRTKKEEEIGNTSGNKIGPDRTNKSTPPKIERRSTFRPPKSELWSISELHRIALAEVKKGKSREEVTEIPEHDVGPAFLVGKPLRLYCPIGNSYHVGRIVDWRAATNLLPRTNSEGNSNVDDRDRSSVAFHGRSEIASSEFLVRFRAGVDGRKESLHKWIILEEHSLAIGVSIVWGQLHKNRGLPGWKPAQTLIRTSLELIPVQHLLKDEIEEESGTSKQTANHRQDRWALALFFGEESHALLRLRDEAVDFFSPSFCTQRHSKLQVSSATKASNTSSDRSLDISVALAFIESEEQERVLDWHTMPVQNPAHVKALSLVDEFALGTMNVSTQTNPQMGAKKQDTVGKNRMGDDNNSPQESAEPRLCPLIEQGLDRLWLAKLLGDRVERSMDTIGSFSCQPVVDLPTGIARVVGKTKTHMQKEG